MRNSTPLAWFWRLVLATSLIAAPMMPVIAAAHGEAPPAVAADAEAMPCHGDPSPPPPADDAPCDDGCCPQPDCDPGACRVAGPLIGSFAPRLANPMPQAPAASVAEIVPPHVAPPPLLRPPIA